MPAIDLPALGLGTMKITDPDEGPTAVSQAIDIGYRHIDTAQKYGNEHIVGAGIEQSDVPREDLFVATKIEESNLSHDDVLTTAAESVDRLGVDTLDLLYVHWPAITDQSDSYSPEDTLEAFNTLYEDGVVRHVGVANFSPDLVAEAAQHLDAPILANQVEMHLHLQQEELVTYAQANDMYLVAYAPLMRGEIASVPALREIAEKHETTPGQVSLAWLMSKENVVPIPKSSGPHLLENYQARTLELDRDDIERIDAIDEQHRIIDAEKGPWNW